MKTTLIASGFQFRKELVYNDPDYDLIFYDNDGSEVHIGLYKHLVKEIIEKMIVVSKQNKEVKL